MQWTDSLLGKLPGVAAHSLAVHGDTSLLHVGQGHTPTPFLAFGEGDTIGVVVNRVRDTIELCKNGLRIGIARSGVPAQPLYPALGFDAEDACIEVNFGVAAFRCEPSCSADSHDACIPSGATPCMRRWRIILVVLVDLGTVVGSAVGKSWQAPSHAHAMPAWHSLDLISHGVR